MTAPEITPEYAAYEAYVMAAPDDLNFLEWEELPGWQRDAIGAGVQAAFERRAMTATHPARRRVMSAPKPGQAAHRAYWATLLRGEEPTDAYDDEEDEYQRAWDASAQAVAGPLEAEIANLRAQLASLAAEKPRWTERFGPVVACDRDHDASAGTPVYLATITHLAGALRDIRDDDPKAPAGGYAHDRASLALSTLPPGIPPGFDDSVADHPDDCRGACCGDARREAEAQMNADSETEPLSENEGQS